MKISTVYNGIAIEGVVLKHSPAYIEVAITSPFQKLSVCKTFSASERLQSSQQRANFEPVCHRLLIELYGLGQRALA